jgi:hypothetical protein
MEPAKNVRNNTGKENGMAKRKSVLAMIMITIITIILLFSTVFLVRAADHDCTGENCAVCCQMHVCENSLKILTHVVAAVTGAVAFMYILLSCLPLFGADIPIQSLITLKVKLLN